MNTANRCPECGGTKKSPYISSFHRDDNFKLRYSLCSNPFHDEATAALSPQLRIRPSGGTDANLNPERETE